MHAQISKRTQCSSIATNMLHKAHCACKQERTKRYQGMKSASKRVTDACLDALATLVPQHPGCSSTITASCVAGNHKERDQSNSKSPKVETEVEEFTVQEMM